MTTGQISADMKAVAKQPPDTAAVQRLSAVPYYNSLLRTTCVATMLSGGHAPNALPQNGSRQRELPDFSGRRPGRSSQDARTRGQRSESQDQHCSAAHTRWKGGACRAGAAVAAPPGSNAGHGESFEKRLARRSSRCDHVHWRHRRQVHAHRGIPTYGISCMFFDKNDSRAHGKDERVGVQDFLRRRGLQYKLMKELSSPR